MEGYHKSVLLNEVLDALIPPTGGRDAWYLDCTLGDGGHTKQILARGGKVVGIDVDPEALARVHKRFDEEGIDKSKFRLIQGNFRDIKNLISREEIVPRFIQQPASTSVERGEQTDTAGKKFAGAIFDLGVSSLQLETPERGFSFGKLGPLDMRMDPSLNVRALDLVNTLTRKELNEIFSKMGEEKYSWAVAGALVLARKVKPFTTTLELAEVVEKTVREKRENRHPATRVFQALRMIVNSELEALEEGLKGVKDLIDKNGRIVVISFHSLEDRIVKNTFREWEHTKMGEVLTKKPIMPTEIEIAENPRSRSAKMRVFEIL